MKNLLKILIVFTLTLSTIACGVDSKKDKLTIYTTNYAQQFILEAIGQEHVAAYSIYNNLDEYSVERANEFTYQVYDNSSFSLASHPNLAEEILNSDLFIYNGRSKKDTLILNEIIDLEDSEELPVFDCTLAANISSVKKEAGLSYNNQVVNPKIETLLETDVEMEMFWISPIEMQNVSKVIFDMLVSKLPAKEEELKKNYENLLYDMDSLYAMSEDITFSTTNNVIVSDNVQLNMLEVNYIENVYTDHTANKLHHQDEDNSAYMTKIEEYISIIPELNVSTTDTGSANYFDTLEVLSKENYEAGKGYYEIMKDNFAVLERVLSQ